VPRVVPLLLALGLGGCARAPVTPAVAAPPDEAAIAAATTRFLAAYDGAEVEAFTALLGPSFALLDEGELYTREVVLERLARRAARKASPQRRALGEPRFARGENVAVVHVPSKELIDIGGKTREFQGRSTLIWAREAGQWRVAHWQWEKAGTDAERESWNEVYRTGSVPFEKRPNALLVAATAGRTPGAALDLATGQGRNAVYLATRGWKVTGVDLSPEGLRQARAAADALHVPLETVEADMEAWDFGEARWDLVTMIYAGASPAVVRRAARSLKPGGLFVVEVFHRAAGASGPGRPAFATGELAALAKAAGLAVVRDEVVEDVTDWGLDRTTLVRFVAEKR
jgi:SAM-dependent methyltransferase